MGKRRPRAKTRHPSFKELAKEINLTEKEKQEAIDIVDQVMPKGKRKPNAAFMKPMKPSAALAEVIGSRPLPRTQVTKKLWAYIKRKGLQDKKKRTVIHADGSLRAVFRGKRQVTMFEMTKLVNKYLK